MIFSESLPIDDFLEGVAHELKLSRRLVVSATPGAGKTTRIPPYLDQSEIRKKLGWSPEKKIYVLQPRRIAAVAASDRIAKEQQWSLGQDVGYEVRFDRKSTAKTRIVFMTEALLAQKMIQDPELKEVCCVILDEFHERAPVTDLTLALVKELQILRDDLSLIVMSATLQKDFLLSYLQPCQLLEIPGRSFDIQKNYVTTPQQLVCDDVFFNRLISTLKSALAWPTGNHILVFLPGLFEIQKAQRWAEEKISLSGVHFVSLHGQMSLDQQKEILAPTFVGRKVIFCTNVAESSLTVDGVNVVVDSGLEKIAVWNPKTESTSLEIKRISFSSATQRAGRSGRQRPGAVFKMWTPQDEYSMPAEIVPQILRTDLSPLVLLLSSFGVRDYKNFDWLSAPDEQRLQQTTERLQLLKVLDQDLRITEEGQWINQSPLSPELGRLYLDFVKVGLDEVGAQVVSLLNERDLFKLPLVRTPEMQEMDCDLTYRLCFLNRELQDPPRKDQILQNSLQQVEKSVDQLRRMKKNVNVLALAWPTDLQQRQHLLQKMILSSWYYRLLKRRTDQKNFISYSGKGYEGSPQSFCQQNRFGILLRSHEVANAKDPVADWILAVDEGLLLRPQENFSTEEVERLQYDEKTKKFKLLKRLQMGSISIKESSGLNISADKLENLWVDFLKENFNELLKANEALGSYWQRLQFLLRYPLPENHPAQTQVMEFLEKQDEILKEFFTQITWQEVSFESVAKKDLLSYLNTLLPHGFSSLLKQMVPSEFLSLKGKSFSIDYGSEEPTVSLKIQEVMGLQVHPTLLGGLIKLKMILLAPNYRPAQITSDIGKFWKSSYPEIRKELKARYPKHDWPESF